MVIFRYRSSLRPNNRLNKVGYGSKDVVVGRIEAGEVSRLSDVVVLAARRASSSAEYD